MADVITLNDFYNTVKDKGLKTNHQFQIQCDKFQSYVAYAQSASVPGRAIHVEEVPFYGFPLNVPTNTTYTKEWNLTIRCDREMVIRSLFENWMNEISDLRNNTGGSKAQIPSEKARVHLLDETMTDVDKTYVLEGMFPSTLGDISVSHSDNGIMTFDVTLTFQYWYDEPDGDPMK